MVVCSQFARLFVLFLLWTHALRPFINRPIALAQGGEEFG